MGIFHGKGMNLVAICTEVARPGSAARRDPMIRSLSPPPYTSAVSKKVTPEAMDACQASSIEARVRPVS